MMHPNIVILGDECTGKSVIARTFVGKGLPTKYISTIEDCYEKILEGQNGGEMSIIDTAGSLSIFEHSRHLYKKTASAFIITYSVGDSDSWLRVLTEYENLKHEGKEIFIIGTYTNDYLHTTVKATSSAVMQDAIITRKVLYSQLIKFGIKHHVSIWEINISDQKEIKGAMDQIVCKMLLAKTTKSSLFSRNSSGKSKPRNNDHVFN